VLPFPRLGMVWPEQQTVTAIARYNMAVLQPRDLALVSQVKALNPNFIALTSNNACEIGYDPNLGAESSTNQPLAQIPAQWLLTQVGAQLTEAVSDSATTLHVDRVAVSSGGTTLQLFVPGDSVVIDDELAYVQAVDAASLTLTVKRGCVKPAEPHSIGARVAATISFWPRTLMVDASTLCPQLTVDADVGPENWAEYNVRSAAGLLADPLWDGIFLDRTEADESWLIGSSNARTIDPDRSNTLVTDYAPFNAAWSAGIRLYESRIRALVGDNRILLANCGMPNFDLLNGSNFEGFPDEWGYPWEQLVVGPQDGGSYFDWLANARQPNLTMIETYQYHPRPGTDDPGTPNNPGTGPGFVPNYQKMRFGLTSALMNDGFFSYEISGDGHGSLGLLWFDEYDNVGKGAGYLGQPLDSMRRAVAELTGPTLAPGGAFDTQADLDWWRVYPQSNCGGSASLDFADKQSGAGSVRIDITAADDVGPGLPFLLREPIAITGGTDYTLSFWAKSDQPRVIRAWVHRTTSPWGKHVDFGQFALSTSWQQFEVSATANDTDPAAGLAFELGQQNGTVWLDNVRLQKGSVDVWRRDFSGGLALCNPSGHSRTVDLGGMYRRIRGVQVPAVNNGHLVSFVTLPAHDGLILIRPTSAEVTGAKTLRDSVREWTAAFKCSCAALHFYASRLTTRSSVDRSRAARASKSWKIARYLCSAAVTSVRKCDAALWDGDSSLADVSHQEAGCLARARRAMVLVNRAWRIGHAGASRATAARRGAIVGSQDVEQSLSALAGAQ
jgi:hypothetical protein